MIVLAGADLVLPDRVLPAGSLVIDDQGRIAAIEPRVIDGPAGAERLDLTGHLVTPGFIDVHVHGVEGVDALDGPAAVADLARRLPRFGVTAFCPTSVACDPAALSTMLDAVRDARRGPPGAARVIGAHLESNFINPEWRGAQPLACLRLPPHRKGAGGDVPQPENGVFTGRNILDVLAAARDAVGIVTVAPEIAGGLDLVRELVADGHRVSIGHTGATFEEAREAIAAGVRHATHLYNRMSFMTARDPGAVGAVLESEAVAAEIICDGFHVHPVMVRMAVAAKSPRSALAITDGTAAAGLPRGSRARLGSQTIIASDRSATLEDGRIAGSILTMDRAFWTLVREVGFTLVDAARMCATTPATHLGLRETGAIAVGVTADLVIFGPDRCVRQTYVNGTAALS
jgi:N-acetylglucosamine-6-phosphate deacetylase